MKVAIQGQKGSFHSIAAEKMIPGATDLTYCDSFSEVFESLKSKTVDRAVVAVENSLYGSINQVYQLFDEHQWQVEAEHYLRIKHCLIGPAEVAIADIAEVRSQGVALAQCLDFLDSKLPNARRVETEDTAGSVKSVVESGDPTVVAIGSREAAVEYGGHIIREGVETNHQNYTRFFLLSGSGSVDESKLRMEEAVKASFVVTTDHSKGALVEVLKRFYGLDANLTRIESRPVVGQPNTYRFYIDAQLKAEVITELLAQLKSLNCDVALKGVYKEGMING